MAKVKDAVTPEGYPANSDRFAKQARELLKERQEDRNSALRFLREMQQDFEQDTDRKSSR